MGSIYYKPLIDSMVWSFSRLSLYNECPYYWYLKYIKNTKEAEKFYASYGSFMHKLIELFYKKEISKDEMLLRFYTNFSTDVKGFRPSEKIVQKYIEQGAKYLKEFSPLPFHVKEVEKKVEFNIDGVPFIGFIDYLGENDNGELVIVDNKSRDLKHRSKKTTPTLKDKELDKMLTQLYIYSAAIYQEFGVFPVELCFNCFRTNTLIREPFNLQTYYNTIELVKKEIAKISSDSDFLPNQNFFFCKYICGVSEDCIYNIKAIEERGR